MGQSLLVMDPELSALLDDVEIPPLLHLRDEPRPLWQRVVFAVGAGICMVLGVVGWLVPVVTGIPFYVAGAVLLGMSSPSVGRRINAWEAKLRPRVRLLLRPKLRKQVLAELREDLRRRGPGPA